MNNYYPSFSPSIPLQDRLAAMERMQMQSPYGQMYSNLNPYMPSDLPRYNQPMMNGSTQSVGLQGEVVSDYETVKAMKVNLDGSTSYYPSTDGKVIYSKSLNPDGTSNISIYEMKDASAPANGLSVDDETNERFNRLEEYLKITNGKLDELFNVFIGTEPDNSKRGNK